MIKTMASKFFVIGLILLASASITVVASLASRLGCCPRHNRYSPSSNSELGTYQERLSKGWKLKPYTSVVVFGASDSDNAHPRDPKYKDTMRPEPYFHGRFTNGLVFGELLASGILTGHKITDLNYAFGDATVSNKLVNVNAPDVRTQIDSYMKDVSDKRIDRGQKDSETRVLHCFWIGINDVISIWSDLVSNPDFNSGQNDKVGKQFEVAKVKVKNSVKALIERIRVLVNDRNNNGQDVLTDFLVMLIPPLEIVPNLRYQSLEKSKNDKNLASFYLDYVGRLTNEYNQGLRFATESLAKRSAVKKVRVNNNNDKKIFLKVFDSVELFRQVFKNPSKFGFINVNEACWNSTTGGICKNPNQWAYWDTLHPTTSFQKLVAQEITVACNT